MKKTVMKFTAAKLSPENFAICVVSSNKKANISKLLLLLVLVVVVVVVVVAVVAVLVVLLPSS